MAMTEEDLTLEQKLEKLIEFWERRQQRLSDKGKHYEAKQQADDIEELWEILDDHYRLE